MSLILKQQLANTIPTPPAGKGTLFLNDTGALQVRQPDGNLASFPTLSVGTNTQVVFNDTGAFGQSTNFTFANATSTLTVANLSVTGTLNAGDISVSSIANGTSNVDIVGVSGNVTISVAGNANIITATGTGANIAGTLSVSGNITSATLSANGTIGNGIVGGAKTSGATRGTGVTGQGYVTASGDTGAATGVRGFSNDTHSGGYNVGVLGNASGSGLGNYAFYVQAGNIASIETATAWDLIDNSAGALLFNSTGKANIFGIETTDGAEGIFTSGYLNVTGNVTATRLISNIAVGTAPLTVTSTTRVANLNVATAGVANTVNDAAQSNITSVGTLTSVSVSGNANIGNIGTALITATGNITGANLVTGGVVSATGNVTGNFFIGNGSQLTGLNTNSISSGNSNVSIPSANGNVNISAVGNANVVVVTGTGANITGTLSVSGNANVGNIGAVLHVGNLSGTGNSNVGNLGVTGVFATTLSASGNANAGNLGATGVFATTLSASGNANVGNLGTVLITATGNITGANLVTGGVLNVTGNANVGNIGATAGVFTTIAGSLTTAAQGNITSVGTLTSLNSSGTITAPAFTANTGVFTGNGNGLSSLVGANVTGTVPSATNAAALLQNTSTSTTVYPRFSTSSANGNASAVINTSISANLGNASITATTFVGALSGAATSATTAGTVTTNAQPNITSTGTLASLSVSGNANVGNIGATLFVGNLSGTGNSNVGNLGATGIFATTLSGTGNANVGNIGANNAVFTGTGSFSGNVNMNSKNITSLATPVSDTDAATKAYVDSVAQGLDVKASVVYASTATLFGNGGTGYTYNNGTSGVGATLTNSGTTAALSIDGNTPTLGDRVLVKNESGAFVNNTTQSAAFNGIYTVTTVGTVSVPWVLTRATDMDIWAEVPSAFVFVEAGSTNADTGWVSTANAGGTMGTTQITWAQFSGAGSYSAGTGLTLTGSTFSVNTSQTQVTVVGTLTSLSVSGNANVGNIGATSFIGNLSGSTSSVSGNANAGNLGVTGVFATTLSASGNANAGNLGVTGVFATTLSASGNANAGNLGVTGVFATTLSATGNANIGNIGTAGILVSSITTGTAPFTVASTTQVANLSVATAGSATTAGTVTTAAQGNITSVGTLTSLGVNGTVTAVAFTANTGVFTGNGNGLSSLVGANVTGTVPLANVATYDSITTLSAGNAYMQFSNTLTGTAIAYANASFVANTSNGALYATTFVGALSGAATTAGTVTTAAQGNITSVGTLTSLGVNGTITAVAVTANTGVFTGNGSGLSAIAGGNVTGTVSSATSATTAGTVTTAAQGNITSVGTLSSLTSSGNITGANLIVSSAGSVLHSINAAVSAAGTVQANATALTNDISVVTTCVAGAGVVLPTAVAGMRKLVFNTTANACLVYPASTAQINAGGANISYSLAAGARLEYISTSATQWYTVNATYA